MRWGVISTGAIANDFCKAVALHGSEVVAVSSRSQEKAASFAAARGIARAYGSVNELLRDAAVEVVYISNPHSEHYASVMAALRARKPVLCEKPLCWSVEQTRSALAEAARQRVFLMEAMWTRFFPVTKLAKQAALRDVGKILTVHVSFGFLAPENPPPRLTEKHLAGGATLDVGVYPIAWVVMLLGKPRRITACGQLFPTGVDKMMSAQLEFDNGVVATVEAGMAGCLRNEAVVVGTHGQVQVHKPFHCPEALTVTRQADPADPLLLNAPQMTTKLPLTPPLNFAEGFNFIGSQGMVHEVAAVEEALHRGLLEHPLMPHSDTLAVAETMAEILRQIGVAYPEAATETAKL